MGIGSSIFLSSFSCLPVYLWGKKEMEKEKFQGAYLWLPLFEFPGVGG